MPKNILIDLNIILDVVLKRSEYGASLSILKLTETAGATLFISAHAVTTFAYMLELYKVPQSKIKTHLSGLLRLTSVVAIGEVELSQALKSQMTDYEDAVVEQAALKAGCNAIITRNSKDFKHSTVPAFTPEKYLESARS